MTKPSLTLSTESKTQFSLQKKYDRQNNFSIARQKNDHGFYVYALENTAEQKTIFIPRFVFGKFRAALKGLQNELARATEPFEESVSFLNHAYFYFKSSRMDLANFIIQDLEERKGSSGYITVSRKALAALCELLYSERLQHPNDILENIISYHKLFQFSFVKGSKSITSDLILRKDVLQAVVEYRPTLAAKSALETPETPKRETPNKALGTAPAQSKKSKASTSYQPKLGERFHEKEIKVNYAQLFGDKKVSFAKAHEDDSLEQHKPGKSPLDKFITPLSAADIKAFTKAQFSFELSSEEALNLRTRFIHKRSAEFYLGFEIVDALFTFNKTVKSFQFPLYYVKVSLRESGREVRIEIKDDGRVYLNHLALAHLVEKFSTTNATADAMEDFFNNLLAQCISVDQLNDRICLVRHLPVADNIFDRTREILFGYQKDGGKGGLFSDFKFQGVEVDLLSSVLYRSSTPMATAEQALELDLDTIYRIAHQQLPRFYRSLLGKFLTPELRQSMPHTTPLPPPWVPGHLPKSTRKLFTTLHHHDIVLLEGPPGTGKTHTILHLLIDAVCQGKRLLIVSDQQAAIEALVEKIQHYLAHPPKGVAGNGPTETTLLSSAIKILQDTPEMDASFHDVIDGIQKALKVTPLTPPSDPQRLQRKRRELDQRLQQRMERISQIMQRHMATDLPFERLIPMKGDSHAQLDPTTIEGIQALFQRVFGSEQYRSLIREFIFHRQQLYQHNLLDCFSYFRLHTDALETQLDETIRDIAMLEVFESASVNNLDEFHEHTQGASQHEILRFLEKTLREQTAPMSESTWRRLCSWLNALIGQRKSPFQLATASLLAALRHQRELLQHCATWPKPILEVLNNIHESLRQQHQPSFALSLYQRFDEQSNSTSSSLDAVQAELDGMSDEYEQRDALVYECFVQQLLRINAQACANANDGGTDAITRIFALADSLKQCSSLQENPALFEDFRQALFDTFPVWLARKQNIALLLPCEEQSFDLVVIDEATQCRVDDALSLMYRAKKVLVVGDDKQTVLQKDSAIDDYLFKDHELDEHLRSTQAQGFKGGGSHIFGLIKSIKQGSVMLDEHYRCPADIIEFSNHYVYNDELKVMQWRLPHQPPCVEVCDREISIEQTKKPSSGKFKGIETAMIDRFFEYMEEKVLLLEKELGRKIQLDKEVAICYFLMKNEPYVKQAKANFLAKMNRGEELLDGAGAALQGKERDYIFYLWDITRYNLAAFTQGDDENKRKGELNVLMSRPKKKAFHYLHNSFPSLDHSRAIIAQYLQRLVLQQSQQQSQQHSQMSASIAQDEPLSVLLGLLSTTLEKSAFRNIQQLHQATQQHALHPHAGIAVGDTRLEVDVMLDTGASYSGALGLVDLAAFNEQDNVGLSIADYFFQLKRAIPKIDPVFLFHYELLKENGYAMSQIVEKLHAHRR